MTLAVPWNFAATIQPEPLDAPDIGPGAFQSPDDAVKYATKVLYPGFRRERDRLRRIDMWYKGIQADPNVPRGATRELRSLLALSKTPWLGLVVTTIAQTMFVDGYRSPKATDNTPGPWMTWQANDFDVRQTAIHRAALGYGYSYATALPGLAPDGTSRSALRGISPKRMFAVYEDPASDDFPQFAIRMDPTGNGNFVAKLYDDTFEHSLTMTNGNVFTYVGSKAHGAGVCPVVRYTNMLDLDGRTPGEVEPFIPIASRIDKTIFDRLMTQHFLSWKVRYIAGLANFAESEEEANVKKFKLRQSDILVSEDPDTKFGTIDGSDPTPLIGAAEADIEALAAVSQMPSHVLTGKMINLPLALDTIVPVPGGRTTMGELAIGDLVFAPDGSAVPVTALSPIHTDHKCYRMTFDDGTEIVSDAEHGWNTTRFTFPPSPYSKAKGRSQRTTGYVTTREIAETLRTGMDTFNHFIPVASPHDGPAAEFAINPYTLGVWLGDGDRINGLITSHNDDVAAMASNLEAAGERVTVRPYRDEAHLNLSLITMTYDKEKCPYGHVRARGTKFEPAQCVDCRVAVRDHAERVKTNPSFPARMKELGVWKNKHIPEQYFHGSYKQRLALLQGLMDTDGTANRGQGSVAFTGHDERLCAQVLRLIRSLGHKAAMKATEFGPRPTPGGAFTSGGVSYRITWSALDCVFQLPRKAALQRTDFGAGDGLSSKPLRRYIVACEPVESVPVRCITVDSAEHLFCVTDSFIATHNSAEALAASRAPLTQKVAERQISFGASHSRLLRLASKLEGDTDAANDVLARVTWQDMEIRSLSQAADALGKLAQMLGVPREDLWERIPGVSQSDIEEWKTHAMDDNPLSAYLRGLEFLRTTPSGDAIIGGSAQVRSDASAVAPPIPSVHP